MPVRAQCLSRTRWRGDPREHVIVPACERERATESNDMPYFVQKCTNFSLNTYVNP